MKNRHRTPHARLPGMAAAVLCLFLTATSVNAGDFAHAKAVHLRLTDGDSAAASGKFLRQLERARMERADLVILEIGGDANEAVALEWHDALRRVGWAKTAAVCTTNLHGGALFAALACDELFVAPDALVGSLNAMAGKPLADPAGVRRRVLAAQKDRRRSTAVGLALLDPSLVVLAVEDHDTGARRCLTPGEWESIGNPARERIVERLPEFGDGVAALLSGKRALEYRVASGVVADLDSAFDRLGVKGPIPTISETWVDDVAALLNHPFVSIGLVVVGLAFVYIEFMTAGLGLATLPACLCFLLFFWSKALGGTAGWLEVVLFLAGTACLLLEIFVIPGFGVVGVTGLALMLASIVMATQGFVWPRNALDWQSLGRTGMQLAAGGVVLTATLVGLSRRMQRAPIEALRLAAEAPSSVAPTPQLANAVGVSVTSLRPAGRVKVGELDIDAVSNGFFIPAGVRVRVLQTAGNRVVVSEA